jgi:hypothetical protein
MIFTNIISSCNKRVYLKDVPLFYFFIDEAWFTNKHAFMNHLRAIFIDVLVFPNKDIFVQVATPFFY